MDRGHAKTGSVRAILGRSGQRIRSAGLDAGVGAVEAAFVAYVDDLEAGRGEQWLKEPAEGSGPACASSSSIHISVTR
jgi:hypothetical protein